MRPALTVVSNYGRFMVGIASVAIVTPRAIAALGIERFGLWSLAAAACGFIGLLELGVATTAMRFAAESEGAGDTARRNARLSTLLVAQLPLAAAMLVVGWFGARPLATVFGLSDAGVLEFVSVVRLGATAAALALPLTLWRAALAARGDLYIANFVDGAAIALGAMVSLQFLNRGLGVPALAIGSAVTVLLPAPLLWASLRLRIRDLQLSWSRASRAEWAQMRNFAGAAVSTNTANLAAQRLEPVLVNVFLPLGSVGQYSIAARIAEYALLLGRQLSSALTPIVARAHGAGDHRSIQSTLVMGTRFQVALMFPCALLLGWHAPTLLHAWLGSAATGTEVPLRLLCVALAAASIAMNPAICLGMTGQHRFVAKAALGGAGLRLAVGAALMPFLGLVGAGLGAIAAALLVDVALVVRRACQHVGVPLHRFVLEALLPTVPGLAAALATASLLEYLHAPSTLGALFGQCALAGGAFLVGFAIFGVPREMWRRSRLVASPAPGV
jgi:O-antigen/teichoic acid export membrane protein